MSLGSVPGFSLLVSPWDLGCVFLLLGTAQTGEAEIGLHLSSLTDTCVHASSVTWSCPTLCDPKDCSPPGSSVHGILQARILEWVAISSSKGSSQPRDRNCVSCLQAASLPLSQQGRPLTDTDFSSMPTVVRAELTLGWQQHHELVGSCVSPDSPKATDPEPPARLPPCSASHHECLPFTDQ